MFPDKILVGLICHVMLRSSGGRPFPLKVPALRVLKRCVNVRRAHIITRISSTIGLFARWFL
jgi:hypothetical protein